MFGIEKITGLRDTIGPHYLIGEIILFLLLTNFIHNHFFKMVRTPFIVVFYLCLI